METEKIPIFEVFKQNGNLKCRLLRECKDYELYGFLKCFLEQWEVELIEAMQPKYSNVEDRGYDTHE
jgi:hypothetical protein